MSITILPGAASELQEAAIYYEAQQAGLGGRFLDIFDQAVEEISEAPSMYSPFGDGFRKYGLRPFPYAVIYRKANKAIVIVAVMHQKRRPGYWRDRL